MNFEKALTRRESIKKLLRVSGCLTFPGTAAFASNIAESGGSTTAEYGFMVEGVGETSDYDVKELTRKTFEAAGGISKFISKGDVVVVKPEQIGFIKLGQKWGLGTYDFQKLARKKVTL